MSYNLVFKPLNESYKLNEVIPLEVKAIEEASQLPQIYVHISSPAGLEGQQLTCLGENPVDQDEYPYAEFAGEYKFIIASNEQYVVDMPLQTVQVGAPRKSPVFTFFGIIISGGLVAGALCIRHLIRLRHTDDNQPMLGVTGGDQEDERIEASLGLTGLDLNGEGDEAGEDYEASLREILGEEFWLFRVKCGNETCWRRFRLLV